MRRVLLAGLVGTVFAVTIGTGVASAYPAAPRAKATVAAPAAQTNPAAPTQCINLDRDNRSLCFGGATPQCDDAHAIIDLSPIVAFYRCGTPTRPQPTPMCFNIDRDPNTLCVFGGVPGGSCQAGKLDIPGLVTYYRCGNGDGPIRRIGKRLPPRVA